MEYYKDEIWYKAPEVLLKDKYFKSSDIWSLGCCLITMLTGERPWEGVDDLTQLKRCIKNKLTPPIPDNLS